MGWGSFVKKVTKSVSKPFKKVGRKIGWNKWGQDALVGTYTGLGGLAVKHDWLGKAFRSLSGVKEMEKALEQQAEGYEKMADSLKSQPTANASLAAGAASTQNADQQAEMGVGTANKRRRTLQSTVSKLGTSGGIGGRTTLG